jgi:hypothetical protein
MTTTPPVTVLELTPTGGKRLVISPLDPDKLVFEEMRGILTDNHRDITVYLDVLVEVKATIRSISIRLHNGDVAPMDLWKKLALETYLRTLLQHLAFDRTEDPDGPHVATPRPWGEWTREDNLDQIAEWYHEAASQGLPTGPYVAHRAGVTHNNARQIIHKARRRGLITNGGSK